MIFNPIRKLIGSIFFLTGLSLLLPTIVFSIFTCHFAIAASRADGTVVRLLPGSEPIKTRGGGGSHPLVRFVPAGAKNTIEFSGGGLNYKVGDKVTVLYYNSRVSIDDPVSLWFPLVEGGVFGVVFTCTGYYLLKNSRE